MFDANAPKTEDDALLCAAMYTRLTPPSRKIQAHFFLFCRCSFSFISATIFVTNKFCSCLQCSIYSEFDSIFFSFWRTTKKEEHLFRKEEMAYFILCVSFLVLCLFIRAGFFSFSTARVWTKLFHRSRMQSMASARSRDRNKKIVNEKMRHFIILDFIIFFFESLLTYMSRGACKVIK